MDLAMFALLSEADSRACLQDVCFVRKKRLGSLVGYERGRQLRRLTLAAQLVDFPH
jgi:hypothetical protein